MLVRGGYSYICIQVQSLVKSVKNEFGMRKKRVMRIFLVLWNRGSFQIDAMRKCFFTKPHTLSVFLELSVMQQ